MKKKLKDFLVGDVMSLQAQQAEAKQKKLDNLDPLVYNIRKDVAGVMDSLSVNKTCSSLTREKIIGYGDFLKNTIALKFPEVPCPVIAGGSIRDMIFGVNPKDYDIFVDVSNIDADAADDLALLISYEIVKEFGVNDDAIPMRVEGYEKEGREPFPVYEILGEDDVLQVIARTEKPLDLLNDFDYTLVKGMYDPVSGEFFLHDDFYEQLKSKTIKCDNDATLNRISSWLWRNMKELAPLKFSVRNTSRKEADAHDPWKVMNYYYTNPAITTGGHLHFDN